MKKTRIYALFLRHTHTKLMSIDVDQCSPTCTCFLSKAWITCQPILFSPAASHSQSASQHLTSFPPSLSHSFYHLSPTHSWFSFSLSSQVSLDDFLLGALTMALLLAAKIPMSVSWELTREAEFQGSWGLGKWGW